MINKLKLQKKKKKELKKDKSYESLY